MLQGKIFKVIVKDLHEIEWTDDKLDKEGMSQLPDFKAVFIGELIFENDSFIILRHYRFCPNPYNLPVKNVGVKLPKSMIIMRTELKEVMKRQD